MLSADDGVMDPANGTVSNALAYGILPVRYELDSDGPGGVAPPAVTPIDSLFGVSSTLVTAMGVLPLGAVPPGATVTYVRRVYVGGSARRARRRRRHHSGAGRAARVPHGHDRRQRRRRRHGPTWRRASWSQRVGVCTGDHAVHCKTDAAVQAPARASIRFPRPGSGPNGAVTQVRTDAVRRVSRASSSRRATTSSACPAPERDDVVVAGVTVGPRARR
jgi:hypothetical protein